MVTCSKTDWQALSLTGAMIHTGPALTSKLQVQNRLSATGSVHAHRGQCHTVADLSQIRTIHHLSTSLRVLLKIILLLSKTVSALPQWLMHKLHATRC